MGADDCQRLPGLKCLLLRKVGKSNRENFGDLRLRVLNKLPHTFAESRGLLTFANGSRIICGHFQNESDIDAYLGLEYDLIGIEDATTLTARNPQDITTWCRSSKPFPPSTIHPQPATSYWRPRIYSTTNPGGVGHAWYRNKFILPFHQRAESDTRFIPARVVDNRFTNPGYQRILQCLSGWKRRAWLDGDWDIAAGQFFTTFRRDVHVIPDFDDGRAVEWFAAMDYGFTHHTVVLLGCKDSDGRIFIVDEHAERLWLPERHALAIHSLLARHNLDLCHLPSAIAHTSHSFLPPINSQPSTINYLSRFVAGADVFSRQSDGTTIAQQYARLGISLRPANTGRINGWGEILHYLGDPDAGIPAKLFIHQRCARLIQCLPSLQHDPNRPEDVLKTDPDDDGLGGDDTADALRYAVSTRPRLIHQRKLHGL
jgi:phage terminase large subunit